NVAVQFGEPATYHDGGCRSPAVALLTTQCQTSIQVLTSSIKIAPQQVNRAKLHTRPGNNIKHAGFRGDVACLAEAFAGGIVLTLVEEHPAEAKQEIAPGGNTSRSAGECVDGLHPAPALTHVATCLPVTPQPTTQDQSALAIAGGADPVQHGTDVV